MVTILKIGDTAIQLTGWIAYPMIVTIILLFLFSIAALAQSISNDD